MRHVLHRVGCKGGILKDGNRIRAEAGVSEDLGGLQEITVERLQGIVGSDGQGEDYYVLNF